MVLPAVSFKTEEEDPVGHKTTHSFKTRRKTEEEDPVSFKTRRGSRYNFTSAVYPLFPQSVHAHVDHLSPQRGTSKRNAPLTPHRD